MTEQVRKRLGRPPNERGHVTKQFTVSFSPADYIDVNNQALHEGCSMAEIVRKAVDSYLRAHAGRVG